MWRLILAISFISLIACSGPKHLSIVVDTSGSMGGRGKTMESVKAKLPKLLEEANIGDTVEIIRFDTHVYRSGEIKIQSDADRKTAADKIRAFQAKGLYTDFSSMLQALGKTARAKEAAGIPHYIVVLSDGKDDPPPGRKIGKLNLKAFESDDPLDIQETYIYYISPGKLADEKTPEKLAQISKKVKTVEVGEKKPSKGIAGAKTETKVVTEDEAIAEVGEDIGWKARFAWLITVYRYGRFVLAALILLWILLKVVRKMAAGPMLNGVIRFHESGMTNPFPTEYQLGKLHSDHFTLGSVLGSNLRIKDLGVTNQFQFKGKMQGSELVLVPKGQAKNMMKPIIQAKKDLIVSGDKFQLGNYVFEYQNESKA